MLNDEDDERNGSVERALIGAAAVAATAGLAYLVARTLGGGGGDKAPISDAPPSALRRGYKPSDALVSRTVTIARPARELYDFWRRFENLAGFMDNVKSVETLDDKRSRWTIAAPGGTEIQFVSRITEDQPGRVIAWESEEDAPVRNSGRVEFLDAAPGRGTMVRATVDYDPPFGTLGRGVAKLLQREPNVQARRDLRRFKQLMETGEITSSASPSGRRSEEPTRQYL
ncbi:SRPBCC family protein [Sphingomonas parva]|uniref:SRPBCC family protein n=2 Tax=Sphingomonas parva TaxID=2555898 RepID=A0A4Y8ZT06_9SPHN|nr:SRPBCC family protein [Sphingomonas parva]